MGKTQRKTIANSNNHLQWGLPVVAMGKPVMAIGYRLKHTKDPWVRSFINVVHPNVDAAIAALPSWLWRTGKYMGESVLVGNETRYYPMPGEVFEYKLMPLAEMIPMDWSMAFFEDTQRVEYAPPSGSEIVEMAEWQS